jgi:hypothetical protein
MKKAALSILTAFVFFVAMAVAQSSTGQDQGSASQGTTGSSPSTSSSPSTPDQSGSSSTMGSQSGSSSTMGQGSSSSGSMAGGEMKGEKTKGEKTLKGCVESEGGQYMLESKKGKEVTLTGADVSSHVGHEVKVHGTWAEGGSSAASTGGAASSGKTFNVTSVDMVSDKCNMSKSSKGDHMKGGSSDMGDQNKPPQR